MVSASHAPGSPMRWGVANPVTSAMRPLGPVADTNERARTYEGTTSGRAKTTPQNLVNAMSVRARIHAPPTPITVADAVTNPVRTKLRPIRRRVRKDQRVSHAASVAPSARAARNRTGTATGTSTAIAAAHSHHGARLRDGAVPPTAAAGVPATGMSTSTTDSGRVTKAQPGRRGR